MSNKNIMWTLELTKKWLKNLGYELMNTDYKVKLILKDSEGYYYVTKFSRINYSKKLPNKFHPANPYTIQNIDLYLSINYPNLKLIDRYYINSKTNFTLQSKEGYLYLSNIDKLRYTYPSMIDPRNPYTIQNIKLWCKLNNKPFELLSDNYELDSKKLKWKCLNENCGEIFEAHWNAISQNTGCGYCNGKKVGISNCLATKNPELAKEWHPTLNNELTSHDMTSSSGQYVWWKCNKCGWEWESTIDNRSRGRGCPKCAESKGEKQIDLILTKYNIPHDSQYTFDNLRGIGNGLLKFDAPVFWDENQTKLRMLIEYDGIFHYEKQYDDDGFEILQIHDKLKDEYCINHNIKLLRIPYWDFDNIEEILKKELNLNDIKLAI